MSKKLFLALVPFLVFGMSACQRGNGGASSGGGSSKDSGTSSQSSQASDESGEGEESSEEGESSEVFSTDEEQSEITLTVGDNQYVLYIDSTYTPGDTADMAAKAKYFSAPIDVLEGETIALSGLGEGLGYGANPDGTGSNKNNKTGTSASDFAVHNDAEDAVFYLYEYDGVTYGDMAGYSFWLTGYDDTPAEGNVNVSVKINYGTNPGEAVFMLLDDDTEAFLNHRLTWTTGNDWVGTFELEEGPQTIKFAIASYDDGGVPSRVESSGHDINVVEGMAEQVFTWNA